MIILQNIKFAVSISFIFSIICSCHTNDKQAVKNNIQKFDKIKWQTRKADIYPYRNEMLDDLIKNVTLKGLKKADLIDLLGPPARTDADYLFYTIAQPKIGIVTLYNKSLVIKLNEDSIVEWRKIHE